MFDSSYKIDFYVISCWWHHMKKVYMDTIYADQ